MEHETILLFSALKSISMISNSASRSTIHQGESVVVVRAKLTALDRFLATALVAKPCLAVELCQAGLFTATFVPSKNHEVNPLGDFLCIRHHIQAN